VLGFSFKMSRIGAGEMYLPSLSSGECACAVAAQTPSPTGQAGSESGKKKWAWAAVAAQTPSPAGRAGSRSGKRRGAVADNLDHFGSLITIRHPTPASGVRTMLGGVRLSLSWSGETIVGAVRTKVTL
jgi:hypothetical protein